MMEFGFYLILFMNLALAAVAVLNFLTASRKSTNINNNEMVSVLIPARNEENNIGNIIEDLVKQDHKNLEIIIFDDQSEDNTHSIVHKYSTDDSRIRLIKSVELPDGWLGKNYACYRLAKEAKGDYLLFIDADVRLNSDIISLYVSKLKTENLKLISIFPRQIMKTLGEWFTVPLMNQILQSLLPLSLVKSSKRTSLSAANGQFMLFEASSYHLMHPHQTLRREKVEDISIARMYKANRHKMDCIASESGVSCRMYLNGNEAIEGFSKNVIHYFGKSNLLAILYWLVTFPGLILALFFANYEVKFLLLTALIVNRTAISATSHQNAMLNLFLFPVQQIALGLIILRSIINTQRKSFVWKGRNIS